MGDAMPKLIGVRQEGGSLFMIAQNTPVRLASIRERGDAPEMSSIRPFIHPNPTPAGFHANHGVPSPLTAAATA
jgi:hypothetical protein